ncbi:hypothetical protein vBSsoS008_002 [Shigella phage vB_SsoS_008]|nr:hypothetical protein vBSsoS008_002 [Shigella phage vB_SsoS_008]
MIWHNYLIETRYTSGAIVYENRGNEIIKIEVSAGINPHNFVWEEIKTEDKAVKFLGPLM